MAEEGTTSSIFPPPPPFYKNFTPANIARLKELKEKSVEIPGLASKILDLPPELRFLVPPEPPADGSYRSFGETVDIHDPLPTLKDRQIEQLYPEVPPPDPANSSAESQWTLDRALHLKKMTQSILMSFLELAGLLSTNTMQYQDKPPSYEEKTRQLAVLFFNAHQLINEYRPHQARESLIIMMEEQLEKKKAEIESVKKMREKVEGLLGGLEDGDNAILPVSPLSPKKKTEEESWREEQRAIWAALEEEEEEDETSTA